MTEWLISIMTIKVIVITKLESSEKGIGHQRIVLITE